MATLRYVAYLAEDPAKLVDFYHRFLGTEELGRTADGDITITDGFYNLTFFKNRPELGEMQMNNGLHHIGLQVDDLEEVKDRFLKFNPRGMIIQETDDLQHGEIRLHDPECRPVTVSTKSFGVPASKEKQFPRVRHIAYNALDPETMLAVLHPGVRPAGNPVELPAPPAGPRQPLLRRRQDQPGDPPVLQPSRRPRSQIRHQPYRLSDQYDASDDGRTEQRPENRAAPVDPTLR